MTTSVTLTSDALCAVISTHGARLETLSFEGGASLVLHADPDAHPTWRDVYPGALVGPVANRVAGGRFTLGGQPHQMPCNENSVTALHSGPNGLDQRVWEVVGQAAHALHLRTHLADGDGGLPGNRIIDAHYALEGATLSLSLSAVTDAPTPINIAHHAYWRIGNAGAHRLLINATQYLPVDAQNIPIGTFADVAGTPFDHRTPKALDPTVDHNFCIADTKRATPERVATLFGADGLKMHIDSTEPGLQVYAGAHLPTLPGTDVTAYAGIALEPQGWPDAVNQSSFPAILCSPGQPYRQITQYSIERAT